MAIHQSFQGSQHIGLGQKLANTAHTFKHIYSIGSTICHVGKAVAPIIAGLL